MLGFGGAAAPVGTLAYLGGISTVPPEASRGWADAATNLLTFGEGGAGLFPSPPPLPVEPSGGPAGDPNVGGTTPPPPPPKGREERKP